MLLKEELIRKGINALRDEVEAVAKARGPLAILQNLARAIAAIVHEVEELKASVPGGLSGADAKQLALDILFALVKLPAYLPRMVAEPVAGIMIDMAVDAVNRLRKKP